MASDDTPHIADDLLQIFIILYGVLWFVFRGYYG